MYILALNKSFLFFSSVLPYRNVVYDRLIHMVTNCVSFFIIIHKYTQPGESFNMSLIGVRSKSFRLPAKQKNALRLFNLTWDLGTQAVRHYFDSIIPPNKLAGHLAAPMHEKKLRDLIKKRVLKKRYEEILYPTTATSK